MERNIKISYVLSFLKFSWFWAGIWVFYYLRFTDYAGIGLVETVMILTTTLGEIPTGALGDLLGKKYTLLIAFLFESLGSFIMAFTPNLAILTFSVFVMCIGGSMYSGTAEALTYDTLKQLKKEGLFDKIIANTKSFQWLAVSSAGILGGFLYSFNPSYPFIASGIFYFFGVLVSLLITEPRVDTEKFSLTNFMNQNRLGVKELFKTRELTKLLLFLLAIGSVIILSWEMLENILAVEFGFNPINSSIFFSALYLLSALGSQFTKYFKDRLGILNGIIIMGMVSVITFFVSPFAGLIVGGISLVVRSIAQVIIENLTSVSINNRIDSKYRSTAISTFNMIKNIPYVLTAYLLGYLMDIISAKNFAFGLGIILLMIISIWKIISSNASIKTNLN